MSELSSRALTLRYLLALGLIAVFSLLSHMIVSRAMADDDGSAAVVAMSMRQLVLSQRIADLADRYALGEKVAHAELHQALQQFASDYRTLSSDEGNARFAAYGKPQALAIYRDGLGARIKRFIHLAHRIDAGTPGQPEFSVQVSELRHLARERLPDGMEAVAAVHVHASEYHVRHVQWLQRAILGVIFLLLLAEALGIFRPMIRRIVRYARQLQHLASHDALTNVLNRREFNVRGQAMMVDTSQYPLHVVMLDVDHFKSVNDRYGHPAGDQVLAGLADLIRGCLRAGDMAARVGGEEFALLLPRCSTEGATALVERLRMQLVGMSPLADAPTMRVTISAGIAEISKDAGARAFEDAMRKADHALYSAKRDGRDRVVHAACAGSKSD